uniref:Glycoprotein A33 n=1 Tax=Ursus maritimus TaxID=29073 RepID=A0A452UNV3_URSMA
MRFWVTVNAISVETPQDVLRAARGKSVTLPCTYHTSASDRNGFIQWDKLLRTHTERVLIWQFLTKSYIYGDLYKNRANISSNAEQSDASITINQLTMDDNGTYECSVSLMADLEGTSKSRVRLLVLGEWKGFNYAGPPTRQRASGPGDRGGAHRAGLQGEATWPWGRPEALRGRDWSSPRPLAPPGV